MRFYLYRKGNRRGKRKLDTASLWFTAESECRLLEGHSTDIPQHSFHNPRPSSRQWIRTLASLRHSNRWINTRFVFNGARSILRQSSIKKRTDQPEPARASSTKPFLFEDCVCHLSSKVVIRKYSFPIFIIPGRRYFYLERDGAVSAHPAVYRWTHKWPSVEVSNCEVFVWQRWWTSVEFNALPFPYIKGS